MNPGSTPAPDEPAVEADGTREVKGSEIKVIFQPQVGSKRPCRSFYWDRNDWAHSKDEKTKMKREQMVLQERVLGERYVGGMQSYVTR